MGIDLGTTNSSIACFDGQAVTEIRNAEGSVVTPSVVRIDGRERVTVGARARKLLETDPANTRGEFKRLMGTDARLRFEAAQVERSPVELSAEVLRSLASDFEQQMGFALMGAVITVPALFELPQAAATTEAARLAGLSHVELLQEPVASAIAAGWRATEDTAPWLVFDLGGGTFDASLLRTEQGILRVIGHDGDNFLGGRDIDTAILEWLLDQIAATGLDRPDPNNPADAPRLRQLRIAAERAKIDLSRLPSAEVDVTDLLGADGLFALTRTELANLAGPVVRRCVAVCRRLLASHGVASTSLGRVVLVGGPTMMPVLREIVRAELGAPLAEGIDPMTAVARGAAIFAMSAGVSAVPRRAEPSAAPSEVSLQYPAMTADPEPFVVGRLSAATPVVGVFLARRDGLWRSPPVRPSSQGTFAIAAQMPEAGMGVFDVVGTRDNVHWATLSGGVVTIAPGLTLSDPPLARSIALALANDRVQVFCERGSPLPSRRTFAVRTVDAVYPGRPESALRVPIVQGEYPFAHLCRLVGSLIVTGAQATRMIPVGSTLSVTIGVDRGGHLSATATVEATGEVFDQSLELMVERRPLDEVVAQLLEAVDDLRPAQQGAFASGDRAAIEQMQALVGRTANLTMLVASAKGGDADAGEQLRRLLVDLEGAIHTHREASHEDTWRGELVQRFLDAESWVQVAGTEMERTQLAMLAERLRAVIETRDIAGSRRLEHSLRALAASAAVRTDAFWASQVTRCAETIGECSNPALGSELVAKAQNAQSLDERRQYIEAFWKLRPIHSDDRRGGHGSGVV